MKTIVCEQIGYPTYVFEPVTEFPIGYSVWNISRKNFPYERCVPLCKLDENREFEWQMNVDTNNLKYIVVKSEKIALKILKEAGRHEVDEKKFFEMANA